MKTSLPSTPSSTRNFGFLSSVVPVIVLMLLSLAWPSGSSNADSACERSASSGGHDDTMTIKQRALLLHQLNSSRFHPVVILPQSAVVLDLTKTKPIPHPMWSVGRYNEDRMIYDQPLFGGKRTIHVGIDLGGPANTAVHAFADGVVIHAGINPAKGDYGPTIITEHELRVHPSGPNNQSSEVTISLYALYGHLSEESLRLSPIGKRFRIGDVLGWLGTEDVNGGWPPHVHFQLSVNRPETHDLPGAVAREDLDQALLLYPDPRVVLGKVHD